MKLLSIWWSLPLTMITALSSRAQGSGYVFSTLAGRPSPRGGVGPGEAALAFPKGIAVDRAGNVFVADSLNHLIRKITPTGALSTLAGQAGRPGNADGTGTAAQFNLPYGVALDPTDNVYVTDTQNNTIRKITPAGVVSTLAGRAGEQGAVDGAGSAARFSFPTGIALDRVGGIYVADTQNNIIRNITRSGVVTTFAGAAGQSAIVDGSTRVARFNFPVSVATDGSGNIYVADIGVDTIRMITPAGAVTTLAGLAGSSGALDGVGSAARFALPVAVATDKDGNVYVADSFNDTIRKISPAGTVTTLAGLAGIAGTADGLGSAARFDTPSGLAVDESGNVFVSDTKNGTIRALTRAGRVTTFAGIRTTGAEDGMGDAAGFNNPAGVAVDLARNVYVADTLNHTVRKITPTGSVSTLAGQAGQLGSADGTGNAARFEFPLGLAVDGMGNIYVTSNGATVRKITPAGVVTTIAGRAGIFGEADGPAELARFSIPNGLAVDASGNIYVADQENSTIRKITPAGVVSTIAGVAGQRGGADGPGHVARFIQPAGITLDRTGNLYVSDRGAFTLRKISPDGVVSTLAGQHGVTGTADGLGQAARFALAGGVAIDRLGTLYVADGSDRIRQVTAAGMVTTLVASDHAMDSQVSGAVGAQLDSIISVATDLAGNLYLADSGNHTIRKGVSATRVANLSIRSRVGPEAQTLIMGFVISAGGEKPTLVRGIGPSLGSMGVPSGASDPRLKLFDSGGKQIHENDNWGGSAQLNQAFTSLGAFPLPAASKDAALLLSLASGAYSAHVTADSAGGVALLEAYDADLSAINRLINVSARSEVGSGDGTLIAGFVLSGSAPKTVLIRGVGPSLATLGLGSSSVQADPKLALFRAGANLGENDNWDGVPELKAVFDQVGAFGLDSDGSKDAALLATLNPGAYTVHVAGVNTTSGIVLVEIYEVP